MLLSSAYGQAAAQEVLANPNKRTFRYDELLGAYTGVFFGTRPTPTAASDEIETVSLPLSGKDGNESKVAYDVKVGFYGDSQVFIQGLCEYLPESWVRGDIVDGKLVIPNWFFGTEHFEFMGYVFDTDYIFGGASLDYDADKKELASAAGFVITDSDDSTYEYSGVQIVKNNDTAISSLKVQTATEGSYYNISGVRVAAPAKKGIYIHNGRKFVVK